MYCTMWVSAQMIQTSCHPLHTDGVTCVCNVPASVFTGDKTEIVELYESKWLHLILEIKWPLRFL